MISKGNLSTLKRVLKYLKGNIVFLIASLLFAAGTVALTLYLPVLTGDAIDMALGKDDVDFAGISEILGKMLIIIAFTGVFQWLMGMANNKLTYSVVKSIRFDVFKKLQRLPVSYEDNHPTGETVSRVIADADRLGDGLLMGFTQLFSGVLTIAGTLIFMATINPIITLVVVLVTPVSLFVAAFIAKRTYSMFKRQSEINAEQTSLIDESMSNPNVVTAFGREKALYKSFDGINENLRKCSLRAMFFSSITNPSTRFVNNLVYTGVALAGAITVVSTAWNAEPFTVGMLTCFLSYANQYTKPFNEISGVVTELQGALASAAKIFEILDVPDEIPTPEDALVLDEKNTDGTVSLHNVYFSYVPDRKLITDFNLDVKPGERVAIVGPTGCGKTTMINLLMRFYDVDSGSIKVSGTDIRNITRGSLRSAYGMVLQETWLKSGTIKDNIIMGNPDATDEEIKAAAKATYAHSFIKRLPDGYDTVINENDSTLSQGQKQLLCITRAMISKPEMLILDEATSSIDTRTEQKIQGAFAAMMKGRTSFIVAHRLSTIKDADIILVMKDGNVIEQGTHDELLAKNGFYTSLYNSQFVNI
ncbi:MAG: ABC transporter ATP-binding protein/permease [Clostridia bacterium]|nr:ABC transporter ATP-binding protein/permease [Clostridia bacterium]MDY3785320.1 ABC transporter ATP-binding protein [Eubacteriales bacterium]